MKVYQMLAEIESMLRFNPEMRMADVTSAGPTGSVPVKGINVNFEKKRISFIVKDKEVTTNGVKLDYAWIDECVDDTPLVPITNWQTNPAYANFKDDLSAALVGSRSLQDKLFEQEMAKQIRKDNERAIMERLSSFPDVNQRLQIADILLDGFEKLRKDIEAQYQKK